MKSKLMELYFNIKVRLPWYKPNRNVSQRQMQFENWSVFVRKFKGGDDRNKYTILAEKVLYSPDRVSNEFAGKCVLIEKLSTKLEYIVAFGEPCTWDALFDYGFDKYCEHQPAKIPFRVELISKFRIVQKF